jgi:hypothetical protein
MNQPASPSPDPAPPSASVPPEGVRPPRTPLVPARVGESVGEDADPEQDVAPNLGGEQQMQDACGAPSGFQARRGRAREPGLERPLL